MAAHDLTQVFGLNAVQSNKYPSPVSKLACTSSAALNLWYGELYAVATGRKVPSQTDITSFWTPPVDLALIQQLAPAVREHHHKPAAAPVQSALSKHQGISQKDYIKNETAELSQLQKQKDYNDWQTTLKKQSNMIKGVATWVPYYLQKYQINTIPRISAFLGNTAIECNYFTTFEESEWFISFKSLHAAHGTEFPTAKSAEGYLENPQAVANYVYSDQFHRTLGNGPFGNGNGWKYRGRGIIQLTGLANYKDFSKDTGVDAVSNPDLLFEPQYAILSAFWFWDKHHLNDEADNYNFLRISQVINGQRHPLGWADREKYRDLSARYIIERMLSNVH